MVKIVVPNPKISEFVELHTGTYIFPADLETYRSNAFKSTSLTETDRLLSILNDGDRSCVQEVEIDGACTKQQC
jgi:hypothetical protein